VSVSKKEDLRVVVASDENYCFLLLNAVYTLLKHNGSFSTIVIYIIDGGLQPDSKKKIIELVDSFDREVLFLSTPHLPGDLKVMGQLNISTYYRLMLCSLLPVELEKLLYLDVDILVRGSIKELWCMDIDEYYLAGVHDTTGRYARQAVEMDANDVYVNAGVLLINLKKWREDALELKFLDYLKEKQYQVVFNDQGVINHCCSQKVKLISPTYNFMTPYDRYSAKNIDRIIQRNGVYSKDEIRIAKQDPRIVHFAGYAFLRPWFLKTKGRFNAEFLRSMIEINIDLSLRKQPCGFKYQIRKFVNKLPDAICITFNQQIDWLYKVFTMKKSK